MSYNILEAYQKQKQQPKPKPKKRTTCFDCMYSRGYDSNFDNEIIEGRVYCRQWLTVLKCGRARHCQFFERNEEVR